METIRMFLAYACSRKIKVYQLDVKSNFVNGELEEEDYIKQLVGFVLSHQEDYVCRLKKTLYGLKQDPRAWYASLDECLHQQGFKKGRIDNNLYIKVDQDNLMIIEVYVDDIIFGSNDDRLSKNFPTKIQSEFEMSLPGEITYFLGLYISQRDKGIFIYQTKYIKEMLNKFKMEDCKPVLTPMVIGCKLSLKDSSKDVDQRLYRSMIGTLLYVTTSRPDIMQVVGQVERFQATPKKYHIISIKRIL